MKVFKMAAVAALGLAGMTAAMADVVPVGPLQDDFVPIGSLKGVGSFTDEYVFSVSTSSFGAGGAVSVPIDLPNFPGIEYKIDLTGVYLKDASDAILASDTNGADGFSVFSLLSSPGTYKFVVTGNAVGTMGGSYGGILQTVTAVPEPETYAMMLAGLGAMGFMARRRKS